MEIENVRRKIRALRATAAEGSGATEPERDTAKRLADKLMAEYGLDKIKPRPAPAFERPKGPKPDVEAGQFVVVINGQYYVMSRGGNGFQSVNVNLNQTTTTNGGGFPW